jgi:hypothetical protein
MGTIINMFKNFFLSNLPDPADAQGHSRRSKIHAPPSLKKQRNRRRNKIARVDRKIQRYYQALGAQ